METRIGLRELRQHASRWVQRAERGERIEITRHGVLVAVLSGVSEPGDSLAGLEQAGLVVPPADPHAELPEPVSAIRPTGDVLDELRGER